MSSILSVNGLSKRYKTFSLNKVTFEVPSGYIMGFIGPNGAGKTTTIKSILNLVNRDAGSVSFRDVELTIDGNSRIGVVMDNPLFCDDWTLKQVESVLAPFYTNWDSKKYHQLLKEFSLSADLKVKELSRGMKVKLQIAAALSHDADLLILDEPTSGLDPVARDEICDLLREFVVDERKSVLFSTHITADLEKTADFITFILNGSIIFSGSREDLLEKYARVTGGLTDLNPEQQALVIGWREHPTGFEGIVKTSDISRLPGSVLVEQPTLDEIIIYMNREASKWAS